ncbi:MAG: insulinase family protein [Bacteroidales bacterium]|nr:insulinase family protein [Bacteroidales bacterium]
MIPAIAALQPRQVAMPNGNSLNLFASGSIDMLKVDFAFEAGSVYQSRPLIAAAAVKLLTEGSRSHSAQEVAEFMDYRGITVEKAPDFYTATLTAYLMPKYAADFLPLLRELMTEPSYPADEVRLHAAMRRQQLQASWQRTNYVARNLFYERLFGPSHPLSVCAVPDDVEGLTPEALANFHAAHYRLADATIALAGNYNDDTVGLMQSLFGSPEAGMASRFAPQAVPQPPQTDTGHLHRSLPQAAQDTLRLGRLLPFEWHSPDYARFMVLNTILGGYFGSRLMSNLREDKGYTYGIYSQTHIMRSQLMFYVTAEVDSDHRNDALLQVRHEMERLQNEPVPDAELQLIRSYMKGDFMRSVDGVFECSERYLNLCATNIDDRLGDNLLRAIDEVTPAMLMELAQRVLDYNTMTIVTVGR